MEAFDVVIIGAGAAGLMCAISAGRRGRRVLVLDHADSPGKKILISGGGRCNFTNREVRAENFLSGNRHFARSALARYRPEDFIALLQRHGIAWHEKTLGQLFCDGSARQVVAMLLAECEAAGVTLRCNCPVTDIGRSDRFRIETAAGSVTASSLVLATGGLSIPKMGATGFAHEVAARFDLALTPIRPALVPLTFGGEDGAVMHALSGVALPVAATYGRTRFKEALLFTHRGLSGPAILQISSYWREGEPIALELLPDATRLLLERKRARPRAEARTVLGELLPTRLAQALAERHLPSQEIGNIPDRPLRQLGDLLAGWRLTPSGTEGYAKAEVTGGGIDTTGLSSRTMESTTVPGLFAIGEAVDVTGWLGGYNFQWAWASGWVAGEAA